MITPPPNPHASAARAAMQQHNAAVSRLRGDPPVAPPPPPDLIERVFAQWPDMARYRDTARIERVDYWRNGAWCWTWMVTIDARDAQNGA